MTTCNFLKYCTKLKFVIFILETSYYQVLVPIAVSVVNPDPLVHRNICNFQVSTVGKNHFGIGLLKKMWVKSPENKKTKFTVRYLR